MLLEATAQCREETFRPKKRTWSAPHFWITDRDEEVISVVYRYRALGRSQIEKLFFASANRTRERLHLLYQSGYLGRVPRMIYPGQPSMGPAYRLAARGAQYLSRRTGVSLKVLRYWGRTVTDPYICHGKPAFRGTRVLVSDVLEQVATGVAWETIVDEWNRSVTKDAIREAVQLASQALLRHADEFVVEPAAE
jgi:uncharacterized protein (DUF433 family)